MTMHPFDGQNRFWSLACRILFLGHNLYGRQGSPIAGYLHDMSGSMTLDEAWDLSYWLFWELGVQRVKLIQNTALEDVSRDEVVYQKNSVSCHVVRGKDVYASALGN